MNEIEFDTILLNNPEYANSAYYEAPFNVKEAFGKGGVVRVRGEIDGVEFRNALAPMGTNNCHIMVINKELRQATGKKAGDQVHIKIRRDDDERIVALPEYARKLLAESGMEEFYISLSYSCKKEYADWLGSAKKDETKARRANQFINALNEKREKTGR